MENLKMSTNMLTDRHLARLAGEVKERVATLGELVDHYAAGGRAGRSAVTLRARIRWCTGLP